MEITGLQWLTMGMCCGKRL